MRFFPKKIIIIFLIFLFFVLGIGIYVTTFLPLSLPPLAHSIIIRDMHGDEIGEIIAEKSIRHREMIFSDIPSLYLDGLIYLEDRNFWENTGMSWRGIARSIVHNIQAGKVIEGASTLSAQLIRNALWINEKRDLEHKIFESLYAIRLNHMMSKEAIITEYVNRIGFGYLNYGLSSASEYYFGKSPKHLTQAEQIALLVIPKNPNKYNPYDHPAAFATRYDQIITTFVSGGLLTAEEGKTMGSERLNLRKDHRPTLPFVVDFIGGSSMSQTGSSIDTTIDIPLTMKIDTLARSVLDTLSWRNVSDYGILIAERTSRGPVLRVMIGGKDYHESSEGQVNTTLSLRQPGSTLKPFTYALAFARLGMTPDTTITDLPVQYKTAEGYSYEPKNYSQDYAGEVTLREALSQSINIPAIKLLEQVGIDTLLSFLRGVGITSLDQTADHYGLALTLGDGEVTLFELLQAYSIFPYDGEYCEIAYIEQIRKPCVRKLEKKYSDMITSILSDRYVKLPGFPLYSALDFPDRWVALKTGTSRNFRDNWTVGWTPHYMIGVWTGNKNGENMKGVSGATGAGEIWARIVYALEREESTPTFIPNNKKSEQYLEITSPLDGSLYQKESTRSDTREQIALKFSTNILYDRATWMIDGIAIEGKFTHLIPGSHSAEIILEKDGKEVARRGSRFEVKE